MTQLTPQDIPDLESVTSTAELRRRQSRAPDYAAANRALVFQALYTTKPDGLGMGLSISRSIVEAYRGRLWGTPNAPRGATVQFILPGCDGPSP